MKLCWAPFSFPLSPWHKRRKALSVLGCYVFPIPSMQLNYSNSFRLYRLRHVSFEFIVSDSSVIFQSESDMKRKKSTHVKGNWIKEAEREWRALSGVESWSCNNNIPFESTRLLLPSSGVTFNSAEIHWWGNSPYTVYTYTHGLKHTHSHLHTHRRAASCWLDRLVLCVLNEPSS